jgi:hypothetical protein
MRHHSTNNNAYYDRYPISTHHLVHQNINKQTAIFVVSYPPITLFTSTSIASSALVALALLPNILCLRTVRAATTNTFDDDDDVDGDVDVVDDFVDE